MNSKNIVCINSFIYKSIVYKYLMTDEQLEEYNYITRNGLLMNLEVLSQLNSKRLLNKRYKDKVNSIQINT